MIKGLQKRCPFFVTFLRQSHRSQRTISGSGFGRLLGPKELDVNLSHLYEILNYNHQMTALALVLLECMRFSAIEVSNTASLRMYRLLESKPSIMMKKV
jgi:hypothetical protein